MFMARESSFSSNCLKFSTSLLIVCFLGLSGFSQVFGSIQGEILGASPSSFQGGIPTTVNITVRVSNNGSSAEEGEFILECASKPAGWTVNPSARNLLVNLAPGQTYQTTVPFTVTAPVSGGSGIIVCKLYYDEFLLPNTLLDTYNQNVTAGLPDLTSTNLSISDPTVDPSQVVQVSWTARNQGNVGCGSSQQGIVWSPDPVISKSDQLLGKEPLGSMVPSQSDPESFSFPVPSNAIPGNTYYVGIIQDYDDDIVESNESNNGSGIPVTINAAPDLIVEDISLTPAQVYPGTTTFQRTVRVRNIGNAPSGSCRMRIEIYTIPFFGTTDIVFVPSLQPGQPYNDIGHFSSTFSSPGNYSKTILAEVDCYDEVAESNENNNTRQEIFNINVQSPQLDLLAPNGGEELVVDSNSIVEWDTYGTIPTVNLEVSIDGGANWEPLESNIPNTGQYEWSVTEYWASPTCLLRVSDALDADIYDESENTFQIFVCILNYDLDGNCFVDLADIALLATEWLQSGNPYNGN